MKAALKTFFQPDKMNYAAPMNPSFSKFGMPFETNHNREAAASEIAD